MNTETHSNDFEGLLPTGPDHGTQQEACLKRIRARRKGLPRNGAALDRFMIESYTSLLTLHFSLKQDLEALRAAYAELRKLVDEVTAPPWFPGVFLGWVETGAGSLAEVFHAGSRRLVRLGEDVNAEHLTVGRAVFLGRELNAILGVASAELTETGEIATVERVLDDGRLVLRDRDMPVMVQSTPDVTDARVGAGDSVRWSRESMLAQEPVQGSVPSEIFVTEYLSAQPAQQLGGLASQVEELISLFTQYIINPEMAACYELTRGNTLLMHGPPGNGKTSIARIIGSALAAQTGEECRFASIKGAQLESPWVGVTQQNVNELFRELSRDSRPTLLFIDEVDAIGRTRGGLGGHHSDKFLSAWLTAMDGLERLSGSIGIIASTNRKDLIDQAFLDRLSGMELFIDRPGLASAHEIFSIHLPPTLPYGPNGAEAERTREDIIETGVGRLYSPNADNAISEIRFRDGTNRTVNASQILSGRSIEQICLQARRSAFRRHAAGGRPGVRVEDMEEAVADTLTRLSSTLSPVNARAILSDLPQDLDVVAVEPVRRKIAAHRVLHRVADS